MDETFKPGAASELGRIVGRAATGVVAAQEMLDAAHAADLARFLSDAADAGLPLAHPLVAALAPPAVRVREQTIDVAMTLTSRRSAEAAAGVAVAGRVVQAFAHARYAVTRSTAARMTVHVVAAPASARPGQSETNESVPAASPPPPPQLTD